MSWTAPKTWTVGEVVTAANMNLQLRDNLLVQFPLGAPPWTTYTPTLTQSATVNKTVTRAAYTQIGKTVIWNVGLTCTSSGTANNPILLGLPVTAVSTSIGALGEFTLLTGSNYIPGIAYLASTSTVQFIDTTSADGNVVLGQTGSVFATALLNTMTISASGIYEAA